MKMHKNNIFAILNERKNLDGIRADLKEYILEQLVLYKKYPEDGEDIAYGLAGLFGASSIMKLTKTDPFCEILELCIQLELPPDVREPESTWEKFEELAHALPDSP